MLNIPKQDLLDYYNIMELSLNQIAEIYDCNPSSIQRKMIKYNIPRRPTGRQKGCITWNKGKTNIYSKESLEKMSKSHRGKLNGEKHPLWKGDNVGYNAIHSWINRNKKKPNKCEICRKNKKLELSNKDHKYSRNIEDYQYLCKKCHFKYDLDNNLKKINKRDEKGKWLKY